MSPAAKDVRADRVSGPWSIAMKCPERTVFHEYRGLSGGESKTSRHNEGRWCVLKIASALSNQKICAP